MTTSMMMYPAFQTQHELPHQHFLGTAAAPNLHHHHIMLHHQMHHMQRVSPIAAVSAAMSMSAVPEELRCQYSSKRCENHRTNKKSGGLHKFCAVHREKANRNQMRLDHRRRVLKRLAQRGAQGGASPSSTVSASGSSSPYTTKKRSTSRDAADDDCASVLSVEDNLEIDLMPLALHRENNPASTHTSDSKPLFDPQDLHILETLLFSDDDPSESSAAGVCHGECCGHTSPSASSSSRKQKTKAKSKKPHTAAVKTEEDANCEFAGWLLNL